MALSGGADDGEPMIAMNMTPLIDVLLVLLIMFIITIPVATHSVNIDLPPPNPDPSDNNIDPIKNKVVLTENDEILWNGEVVDAGRLRSNLEASLRLQPEPELQFEPASQASYDLSARVLQLIKGVGVTKFGFVGNEQYRTFGTGGPAVGAGGGTQ